jgi:hypothetical protein
VQIIVLIVAMLGVARLTMLIVDDRVLLSFRRWVINKWGDQSLPAYWVLCPWCVSIWWSAVVMPVAILWPNRWVLAALAIPAASLVTGFLAKLRNLGE